MRWLGLFALGVAHWVGAFLRGLWRSLGAGGSLVTGICLFLLMSAIYFLCTEPGRVGLTRGAFYAAEQLVDDLEIEAEGIRSEKLGFWFFEQLRIDYRASTLAEAQDLAVNLNSLSRDPIDIERVGAKDLLLNLNILNELLSALADSGEEEVEVVSEEQPSTTWELLVPGFRLAQLDIARLQLVDSRLTGIPPVAIQANAQYRWQDKPAQLFIEVSELSGSEFNLTVNGRMQGERFVIDFTTSEMGQGFVSRQLHLPENQVLDARGELSLRKQGEKLLLDINSIAAPLAEHQLDLTGSIEADINPWRLSSTGIWLRVDERRSTIKGNISADGVNGTVNLNQIPLTLSRPWQDILDSGWLSADFSVQGSLQQPNINGSLQVESSYRQQPLQLEGRVDTQAGVIDLQALSLHFAGARIEVLGTVDTNLKALDLVGEIDELGVEEIRRLAASLPQADRVDIPTALSGTLHQLRVEAIGSWKNPNLNLSLSAVSTYHDLQGELTAAISGNLHALTIDELVFTGEKLNLEVIGQLDIEQKQLDLHGQIDGKNISLRDDLGVTEAEGVSLGGTSEVTVRGEWSNPQVSILLDSNGVAQDYPFNLKGEASGDMDLIEVSDLRLELFTNGNGNQFGSSSSRGPQSPVVASGFDKGDPEPLQSQSRLTALAEDAQQLGRVGVALLQADGSIEPRQDRLQIDMGARNLPLFLVDLVGLSLPNSLEGELSLDGRVDGAISNPQIKTNLIAQGEFHLEPWHLQGTLDYADRSLVTDGIELLWAGRNQLSILGSLNAERLDLELRGQGDLSDLANSFSSGRAGNGDVSLYASIGGSPRQPEFQGELRATGEALGRGQRGIQVQPLSIVLDWQTENGELDASLIAQHGGSNAVNSQVSVLIAPIFEQLFADNNQTGGLRNVPFQLQGRGTADLSVIAEYIDPRVHRMRGLLSFNVDGTGNWQRPLLTGDIELSNGRYEHRPSHTRIADINFYAQLSPEEWRIVRGSATDGDGGRINLGGAVFLPPDSSPSFDIVLSLSRAHLLNSPGVRGAISGDARLSGSTQDAEITGRFTLKPLALQIEQWIGSSVPEIQVVEVQVDGPQVQRSSPLFSKIGLDVEIVLDQQSYVRGLGLNSQLRGVVDIRGTADKPKASGELTIVRGSFDLFGKKFDLEDGEIRFENNEVAILVEGVYEYSDGEITAQISGTAADLDITFTSDPSASQDEILAQLLFGKSLSDISPLQAVRLVSVVRSLQSGRAVLDPIAKTRELLHLDTLNIEQEEGDEGDEYALSLGKYITNRIYVELQRSTDPLSPWQAEMQIELRDNLNLEFKSADDGDSGSGSVELQWKKDY
ncbi:translocation/assembly module TamB domain-containing protein [Microbulbifer sp. TRSA002]|uniref:translocation/assembly module TamB domain-containing protein n=1 Tax=Microbulbifer sp. TRSA002 TaxID=3243382 RepID=UPI004039F7D8